MEASEAKTEARDELIATLLRAALSRPEGEREAYLREACVGLGDPHNSDDLLRTVTLRANWESRMAGFLLSPVLARERIDRPFQVGDVINQRFEIVRLAGEGGMGVVYEAVDRRLGERRALKCPRFEFRRRLSPEAVNALHITNPHVCRVHELHTADSPLGEVDFLAMEFLEGETLAARLPNAPPGWLESKDGEGIARQICAGIKAIHAKGIVHCDLKSNNVMLSPDPASGSTRATIMDFGISQTADIFSSQTRGTPAYMAPELWRGQRPTVQSDIYALGVLLYEMTSAGRQPFDDSVTWTERLTAIPPRARASRQVRSAIARCLHPDPARRFQSVEEFEQQMWGGTTRRSFLLIAASIGGTVAVGYPLKEYFWPSSAVRLAILPPVIPEKDSDIALMSGFVHDLSYRLKTIRPRRPLAILSLSRTSSEGVGTATAAQTLLGATHVLLCKFSRLASGLEMAAEIVETSRGSSTQLASQTLAGSSIAAGLLALQSGVVQSLISHLHLRGDQKPNTVGADVYADYLKGLHYARFDFQDAPLAIPYFQRVIAAAPDSALGHAGLAEALLGARYVTGDKTLEGKALTSLAVAEQLDPDLAQVQQIAGRLALAGGTWERALAYFGHATQIEPTDSEGFIGMTYALYLLNRPREAEAAIRSAIQAEPAFYRPYLDAGLFYYEEKNFAEAERNWLEAARLAPQHTEAHTNLANLCLARGKLVDAESHAQEALRVRKSQAALAALAGVRERSNQYAEAIRLYEEAISIGPRTYKHWAGLGRANRAAGRTAGAEHAFRSGLTNSEEGVRTYWREAERVAWCAYYHASLGEKDKARSRAKQALEMTNPTQGGTRRILALTYSLLQEPDEVFRLLEGAPADLFTELANDPDMPESIKRNPRFRR